jgi:Holliday junction DNA helicase RuvB
MTSAKNPDRERIVSAGVVEDDATFELKLRPQRLQEFIGQQKVKENLAVAIAAARSRGEALDHVLLYGPPGLGKTTLATIIANEMGVSYQQTSGPTLQIKGDLTAVLTNVQDKQVMFIDEVHRLQPAHRGTALLGAGRLQARHHHRPGPGGAHAHVRHPAVHVHRRHHRASDCSPRPLRSRLGLVLRLEFYTHADLQIIIERSATILNVGIDADAAHELATRCRGTPRIANRLLRRVRDYAQVRGTGHIDKATAQACARDARSGFTRLRRESTAAC